MKSFKELILELNKPAELGKFKSDVKGVSAVDSRDSSWNSTLPEYMRKYGFKILGSGKYASVFGNDKYSYALKVFMKDSAYLRWMKFCLENKSNPFVPKFRGKVVKISPIIFAIRIEKLEKYNSAGPFLKEYNAWKLQPKTYKSSNPDIQEIFDEFGKNLKLLDLHNDNMMMRGSQEVVIDPYYNWFNPSEKKFTIDPNEVDKSVF